MTFEPDWWIVESRAGGTITRSHYPTIERMITRAFQALNGDSEEVTIEHEAPGDKFVLRRLGKEES